MSWMQSSKRCKLLVAASGTFLVVVTSIRSFR